MAGAMGLVVGGGAGALQMMVGVLLLVASAQETTYRINMGLALPNYGWTAHSDTAGFAVKSPGSKTSSYVEPALSLPEGTNYTESLFETELWAKNQGEVVLSFDVTPGQAYEFTGHFMESYYTPVEVDCDACFVSSSLRYFKLTVGVGSSPVDIVPYNRGGEGLRLASAFSRGITPSTTPLLVTIDPVIHEASIYAVELKPVRTISTSAVPVPAPPPGESRVIEGLPDGIVFNEGEWYGCATGNDFDCFDDAVADTTLAPLRKSPLMVSLPYLNYRYVEASGFALKQFALVADHQAIITSIIIEYTAGTTGPLEPPPFRFFLPGSDQTLRKAGLTVLSEPLVLEPDVAVVVQTQFRPHGQEGVYEAYVTFLSGRLQMFSLPMRAVSPLVLDTGLHVETQYDNVVLDWTGSGEVPCSFDAGTTHTHNPDASVFLNAVAWWDENDVELDVAKVYETTCTLGLNQVVYQVAQDDQGNSAASAAVFHVAPYDQAPGMWVKYFGGVDDVTAAVVAATNPPSQPNYAEMVQTTRVNGAPLSFAAAADAHVVQLKFTVATGITLPELVATGGAESLVLVDGEKYDGSKVSAGQVVDARFLLTGTEDYPVALLRSEGGVPVRLTEMHHDQGPEGANLHTLSPTLGPSEGGNRVTISGVAINHDEMTVLVDDVELPAKSVVQATDERVVVEMPAGPAAGGAVKIRVRQRDGEGTRNVTSNALQYTYLDQDTVLAPVQFKQIRTPNQDPDDPDNELGFTAARLRYCFGHVFFTTHNRQSSVWVAKIDDNYHLYDKRKINTLNKAGGAFVNDPLVGQELQLETILGVQCDPWGNDEDFDVYFTVNYSFWITNIGEDDTTYFPYLGAVVKLSSSDDFRSMEWVVRNLPVSGYDHLVNGLDFLNDRRLLVAVGGQTNAGWPSTKYGGMFESPLTGSVVVADVTKPEFNGNVTYEFLPDAPEVHPYFGERLPTNQRWGDWVRHKTEDDDVSIFATGLRNPFDVVVTPAELVYVQDNGPNTNFGGAVDGYDNATQLPKMRVDSTVEGGDEVGMEDELNLLKEGKWYGHPNVARYREDPEGNSHEVDWLSQEYTFPRGIYEPPLTTLTSPSEGMAYYRADAFGGSARGNLFVGHWQRGLYRVVLDASGSTVSTALLDSEEGLPTAEVLDVKDFPGGALCGVTFQNSDFLCQVPVDANAETGEPLLYQVDPFRAPVTRTGPLQYTISGVNFEGPVAVWFGNVQAEVTEVKATRIRGPLPTLEEEGHTDVVVEFDGGEVRRLVGEYHFYALPDDPSPKALTTCVPNDGQLCGSQAVIA